jgi:hypothetical protein
MMRGSSQNLIEILRAASSQDPDIELAMERLRELAANQRSHSAREDCGSKLTQPHIVIADMVSRLC